MEHQPNTHLLIKDGRKVELNYTGEQDITLLFENKNKVINRDDLMMEVWGYNADVNTRTLRYAYCKAS